MPSSVSATSKTQRTALQASRCRWCEGYVGRGSGHRVTRLRDSPVEHWQECPTRDARNGEACSICQRTVVGYEASQHMVREGEGRWETRHPETWHCAVSARPTWEEHQAEQAEEARKAKRAEERKAAAAEKRKAKKAEEARVLRAALVAEEARTADLRRRSVTTEELRSKNAGSRRAKLSELTITWSDGSVSVKWHVETKATRSPGWGGGLLLVG